MIDLYPKMKSKSQKFPTIHWPATDQVWNLVGCLIRVWWWSNLNAIIVLVIYLNGIIPSMFYLSPCPVLKQPCTCVAGQYKQVTWWLWCRNCIPHFSLLQLQRLSILDQVNQYEIPYNFLRPSGKNVENTLKNTFYLERNTSWRTYSHQLNAFIACFLRMPSPTQTIQVSLSEFQS